MAFNRYRCDDCGHVDDFNTIWDPVPEERRLYKGQGERRPVDCPDCGAAMLWVPQSSYHDLLTGGEGKTVEIDGQTHTFSTVHEMRQFSEASIARARNGEGTPVVFRCTEQAHGNMERNTLRGSAFERNRQVPHDQLKRTHRGVPMAVGPMRPPD